MVWMKQRRQVTMSGAGQKGREHIVSIYDYDGPQSSRPTAHKIPWELRNVGGIDEDEYDQVN